MQLRAYSASDIVDEYFGIQLLPERLHPETASGGSIDIATPTTPITPYKVAAAKPDVITAIGTVADTVIEAIKGNAQPAQPIVAPRNNTPTPTTDNGKKTATILWIVGGVVVVATLLYLAFKPRK